MFIRREFRPCLSLVLTASLWLVPVMLVHAGERTLPTQEEVCRWIATNLDTPPLFRKGDVLTHKDLAKLQPFLPLDISRNLTLQMWNCTFPLQETILPI
jgi:hypothetical protein